MIVWLNGTFGVGKTTVARELIGLMPDTRVFDTEWVGYMLAENFRDHEITDFQQLPPWRSLVPRVLAEVTRFTGQHLVVVQSVLDADYWTELRDGLDRCSLELLHVVLHADEVALTARIEATQWCPERGSGGWTIGPATPQSAGGWTSRPIWWSTRPCYPLPTSPPASPQPVIGAGPSA